MVLAMNLPAGARVWVAAGSDMAWTPGEHLTAHVFDALQGANWQRSGGKGEQPSPIPRPGDVSRAEAVKTKRLNRAREFQARQRGVT